MINKKITTVSTTIRCDLIKLKIEYSQEYPQSDVYRIILQDETTIDLTKYELQEIHQIVEYLKLNELGA